MAGSSEPAFLFLRAKKELMLQQPFSYFCNSPFFVENEIRKLFQCGGHKNGTEEITV